MAEIEPRSGITRRTFIRGSAVTLGVAGFGAVAVAGYKFLENIGAIRKVPVSPTLPVPGAPTAASPDMAAQAVAPTGTPTVAAPTGMPDATQTNTLTNSPVAAPTQDRRTATVTATVTSRPSEMLRTFESLGIEVDIKDLHKDWPIDQDGVVRVLRAGGSYNFDSTRIVPAVEKIEGGKKVWRGWWNAEPAFPLKAGVRFDASRGAHVDSSGKVLFDSGDIFDFSKAPDPKDLVDVRLNVEFAGVFARRGGVTREGRPQHTSYYSGEQGTVVNAVEQFTLIPVPEQLCEESWAKGAATRAYRMAVASFRDNKDAMEGFMDGGQRKFVKIQYFDSREGLKKFVELDGRLIARSVKEKGKDALAAIERLAAGWPISPNQVAAETGFPADKFVLEPKTFEWYGEAFVLRPNVRYVDGVGHELNGVLQVGAIQADGNTTKVFDFGRPEKLAQLVKVPRGLPAGMYVHTGDASADSSDRQFSVYTWGKGDTMFRGPAVEQVTLMEFGETGCPVGEVRQQMFLIMKQRATDNHDPALRHILYRNVDDTDFIVLK